MKFATWFGLMGKKDSASFYIKRLNLPDNPEEVDASSAYYIGEMYLILDRETMAYRFIESALKRGFGWRDVKYSPLYRDLDHDDQFQKMLVRSEKSKN